jgi:endonuclease YncB( thermonuclease family)
MRTVRILLTLTALLLPAAPLRASEWPICAGGHRVTCIVDGDTFWLHGIKYRLSGVDTPEVFHPLCGSERRLAARATVRLAELMGRGEPQLRSFGRDVYDRELVTVAVAGVDVGDTLVGEGLAQIWQHHKADWCS